MFTAEAAAPVTAAEARSLFADLSAYPALIVAASGGPDSNALLLLAARWRKARKNGPSLVAVTVDHGLRKESRGEAQTVRRLARSLGVVHRIVRWSGSKPATGLPQAARQARYRLLAEAAKAAGARHVLTAHTLDDQAETVLMRLAHGSGPGGLAAMARVSALPVPGAGDIVLVRPLLDLPKARLIATLDRAGVGYADDPTNRDPHFMRPRLRAAMPLLEREGLSPQRLALLARRLSRTEAALDAAVTQAFAAVSAGPRADHGAIAFSAERYAQLPAEIGLRLLGHAIDQVGSEGPAELAKLEALHASLAGWRGKRRFRRTLAGALVTQTRGRLLIERAPPRRHVASKRP